jgi:uncharacterized membrane protein
MRNTTFIATMHMSLNLTIVALYVLNLYLRTRYAPEATLPVWLSAAAIVLLLVSGWLGGELAYVHGVGVTEAALPGTRLDVRRAEPVSREAAQR